MFWSKNEKIGVPLHTPALLYKSGFQVGFPDIICTVGAVTKALLKKGGDEIKKDCEKQSKLVVWFICIVASYF